MNAEQKRRFKEIGKDAFIREEMTRLGYWPPSTEAAARASAAERALVPLYEELTEVRTELFAVNKEISEVGDVQRLLDEIRKRRIERVRAEAARRKEEKARQAQARQAEDRDWRARSLPHLGRGVSAGLNFAGGDPAKLEAAQLPVIESAEALAGAMGLTTRQLAWLCYVRPSSGSDHYSRFTIPKKTGGVRVLASPKKTLRLAQGWVAQSVLSRLPVHPAAAAYLPGASVVKNAAAHAGRPVVVKVDLKDFFPSLGWKRVRGYLRALGYNEGVATLLALICTETPRVAVTFDGVRRFVAVGERSLPQGACTSPALSNVLASRLDARLSGLARRLGFTYTRYADDLTFSHESRDARVGELLSGVRRLVAEEKLVINEEKTRVLREGQRQSVTGLVLNAGSEPRPSRRDLRRLRALLHRIEVSGFDAASARLGRDAAAHARGYVSYLKMSRPDLAEKLVQKYRWLG